MQNEIEILFLSNHMLLIGSDVFVNIGGVQSTLHVQTLAEIGEEMYRDTGYIFVAGYIKEKGQAGKRLKGFVHKETGKGTFVEGSAPLQLAMMKILRRLVFGTPSAAIA